MTKAKVRNHFYWLSQETNQRLCSPADFSMDWCKRIYPHSVDGNLRSCPEPSDGKHVKAWSDTNSPLSMSKYMARQPASFSLISTQHLQSHKQHHGPPKLYQRKLVAVHPQRSHTKYTDKRKIEGLKLGQAVAKDLVRLFTASMTRAELFNRSSAYPQISMPRQLCAILSLNSMYLGNP